SAATHQSEVEQADRQGPQALQAWPYQPARLVVGPGDQRGLVVHLRLDLRVCRCPCLVAVARGCRVEKLDEVGIVPAAVVAASPWSEQQVVQGMRRGVIRDPVNGEDLRGAPAIEE